MCGMQIAAFQVNESEVLSQNELGQQNFLFNFKELLSLRPFSQTCGNKLYCQIWPKIW